MLRFYGYFKESVVESRLENYRIRGLIIYYFLEDRSIMITEPKQVNSGTPQGAFLKRQMVIKQDGSQMPFEPTDFRVGLDLGICGRSIRIHDCDQYTREYFDVSYKNFQFSKLKIYFLINRTLANLNLTHKHAQRMHSLTPASQFHRRRIQNFSNSLRRNSVEEEDHPKSNSWITIEKC